MSGAIPPLPQYAFMAWCLVKAQDNFTFTFNCEGDTFSYDSVALKTKIYVIHNFQCSLISF